MLSFLKTDKNSNKTEPARAGWLKRLQQGLSLTRQKLSTPFANLFSSGNKIDDSIFDEIENLLLSCDLGVSATQKLIDRVKLAARQGKFSESSEVKRELQLALLELLSPLEAPLEFSSAHPLVIMLVGVNGSGKTTSAGKLARFFQSHGKTVLFAAGDTFRAAAVEQLRVWGERNKVAVVAQASGDSAAVMFDAVNAASARSIDIVIADTAGRLPTQSNLMEEIKKIKRVIAKALPGAPHEVWLVIDANTGQNAVAQYKAFDEALGLTGLILTKLDGTAKGGVIAAIADYKPLPMRFIGVGEQIDDLQPFHAHEFVDALFGA